jgi:chromate reductase, NAD(P)H dehydrogenase (quinone)
MVRSVKLVSMKILCISGSLRANSINTTLLRAAVRLAPAGVAISVFYGVAQLPLFNPDLEAAMPQPVHCLHAAVAASDGLIIASPEYAHGMSGVMKNTLDWLVSFPPFVGKPVAVINTSPRAHIADAALREVLTTMPVRLVGVASARIALLGAAMTEDEMVNHPAVVSAVADVLAALADLVGVST